MLLYLKYRFQLYFYMMKRDLLRLFDFWFIENFKMYFDKNLEPNQINKKIMIIFFERLIFFCYG